MLNNIYVKCFIASIIAVILYHFISFNNNNNNNKPYKKMNYNYHIIIFVLSFILCFLINIVYCNKSISDITELEISNKTINSNECPF
jgi:anaerobic C4-dicarboxylate transporter